jgi:hypothetical protein
MYAYAIAVTSFIGLQAIFKQSDEYYSDRRLKEREENQNCSLKERDKSKVFKVGL